MGRAWIVITKARNNMNVAAYSKTHSTNIVPQKRKVDFMAVRDENQNWKPEALNISKDVEVALQAIFDRVLENCMSVEDFYCIVNDVSQSIILQHSRLERRKRMKG